MKLFLILAAVILLVLYAISEYLFTIAFRRHVQKDDSEKFGRSDPVTAAKIDEGREWLNAQTYETPEILSDDGLRLKGHYLKNPAGVRTLLMVHGWHGEWNYEFAADAKWLYEQGCSMLLIEQRAQGNSEGKYMTFGIRESQDVVLWAKWLAEKDPQEPVWLYGKSMGCTSVLLAEDRGLPPQVQGIIADCGFASPYEQILDTGKKAAHLPEHPFMDILNVLFRLRTGEDLKAADTAKALQNSTIPVLFIHGRGDSFVPWQYGVRNFEACASEKDLLLVDGAGHCMSSLADPQKYRNKMTVFMQEHETGGEGNEYTDQQKG